jgi:UDP-N-acetylmuramoyl-tripeptide--D-alanyl-D-alanine ligase
MKRRKLKLTQKVKLLRATLWLMWCVLIAAIAVSVYFGNMTQNYVWGLIGLGIITMLPFVLAYGIVIPLLIGRVLIQAPRERALIASASKIFETHAGRHIAIAGSFGKTTAKEILATVLSEGLSVAATPGNMNTPIGISRFARRLTGKEEVLIVELGEERAGDVARLAKLTRPDMGVITGINEAHLQSFRTLDRTVGAIFELVDYLGSRPVYKNRANTLVAEHTAKDDPYLFDAHGANGWVVSEIKTSLHGTTFVVSKGDKKIHAHTKLVGLQTIGITIAAIAIADELGLSAKQITAGLAKVEPFEHRMQPRELHGAWIIDDTYNGNSDSVRDGLKFLKSVDAKRRIYVTPGLVEQGSKTEEVHNTIGRQAAKSANMVVLMKNSVTDYIVNGLKKADFKGELLIVEDPLEFYTNLEHFIAAGDVVLMQNDWTDNYA